MLRIRRPRRAASALALALAVAGGAAAEVPVEVPGRVEVLPRPPRPHWAFVSDLLLRKTSLVDLDSGAYLGMISTGFLSPTAVFPRGGERFYVPETYYSRGSRGERTDVVTFYDASTLAPVGEVEIPAKRAVNVLPSANAALSDDDTLLAVFNMNPATSLSIVDVARMRFAAEIQTPGCSLVYAAGARRFFSLCADGSLLEVRVDAAGRARAKRRSEPFFDPLEDPVTEKAVRYGDVWVFVSFEGIVHPVDVSGDEVRAGGPWSLLTDEDRRGSWRIGGSQHLALHEATGRLYSLVHQGDADSHKDPGTELWVYDLARRERIQRIRLRHPGLSFLSEDIDGSDLRWPFDRLFNWALDTVVPNPGLNQVGVTQDDAPLLFTGSQIGGSLAVYDALSGEFLRRVPAGTMTTHALQAPFGRAAR